MAGIAALFVFWPGTPSLEGYYAASVRSMSMSWHDFLYGALDPAGTITLDKLPGAFWVQALSVRLFGLHPWAIVLPQQIEAVLCVLVLFRVVRRLLGAHAGLLAAGLLAVSPANVALARGNISDSLMLLFSLLAADAAVAGIQSASTPTRTLWLVASGLYVGLAFQAKMLEAWIAAVAMVVVVLLCGRTPWRARLVGVGALLASLVVVSLSWMTLVTLTPAQHRPYVDGSQHNSVFAQVFVYNGIGRVGEETPNQLLGQNTGLALPAPPPPSWHRWLTGALGRDIGWLLPAAVVSGIATLVATRKRDLRAGWDDPRRIHVILWGTWLVALGASFTRSSSLNSYYLAALSPALAALIAGGFVTYWPRRATEAGRGLAALTLALTGSYAAWLLPASGTGLPAWLVGAVIALTALAILAVLFLPGPLRSSRAQVATADAAMPDAATSIVSAKGGPDERYEHLARRRSLLLAAVALAALGLVPMVASVGIASNDLGAFDTPFQPEVVTHASKAFFATLQTSRLLVPTLEQARKGAPYLMATQTSAVASPFIYDTGEEVLPIGGFTGTIPSPTLTALRAEIRRGNFHLVIQAHHVTDPRLVWIATHCLALPPPRGRGTNPAFAVYFCLPADGTRP